MLQQAAGKVAQVALLEDVRRGGDDALEAFAVMELGLARFFHLHDVAVGAQGGKGGGEQLGAVQFRLFLVVVDVVVDDHAFFRRLSRLPSAQHDARKLVAQVFAHPARHFQAAVFALHHHVEEDERDTFFARQHLLGFGAAVRVHEAQCAAFEAETAQRQFGDVVDVGFIIDEQDFPGR
ncbi:hypothetical protein D3C72_1685890 [compost metagenome]